MEEKYNIVLSGRHPGAQHTDVAQKLALLFKCSLTQATHVLSQPSYVVKRNVLPGIADQYKKAIEATGAQCIIQAVPQEPTLHFDVAPGGSAAPVANPVPPPAATAADSQAIAPPALPLTPRVEPKPAASSMHAAHAANVASAPVVQEHPASQASAASLTTEALSRAEATQIFVGKNYEYFERKWATAAQSKKQQSWNWVAFLVGFCWMAFRKMYRYSWIFIGVISLEVICEIAFGLPAAISTGVNIGIAIAFGLKGNAWYQQHVDQQVSQILATHAPEQARIELARQGGTNLGAAVGFVAALLVLLGMIGVIAEG